MMLFEEGTMGKQSILVSAVLCLALFAGSAWADIYLSIENTGAAGPIESFKVTFVMHPPVPWPGYDFEVMSSGFADSALVDNMILHHAPIAPGETYNSPAIPQLEGVPFSVREFNVAGPNGYCGYTYPWNVDGPVVLDESYYSNWPGSKMGVSG
jgi:hypothetical protein